jgi:hypothetical protein
MMPLRIMPGPPEPTTRRKEDAMSALHILYRSAMVLTVCVCLLLLTMPARGQLTDEGWLDAMTHALHVAKSADGGGPHDGMKYEPYLDQLKKARMAFRRSDEGAVYAAMNRLMEMLERRDHGIAPELADWLFNYCAQVTPPHLHDISRHIGRV